MAFNILAINPGSTTTKISIYEDEKELFTKKITHDSNDLLEFEKIVDQKDLRTKLILDAVEDAQIELSSFDAFVGRGGLLKPIPSGTYNVNEEMLLDLTSGRADHASNLGAIIAYELGKKVDRPAYIVDPVVVDEMSVLAKYSGNANLERQSIFHALNQKACARRVAKNIDRRVEDCNFIVAHMGGGISVSAHLKGKVVDTNNALDGDGPFSPERSGALPTGQIVELCFSGDYSKDEIKKMIKGKGGMMSYLGTADALDVEKRAASGDAKAKEVQDALSYQVAKEIGACAAVLGGKVDRVILTGGLAYSSEITSAIKERVEFIAPVEVLPGEGEMEALALGALRVLREEESAKEY